MDEDEDEPTIGRRVARARRRKGWSQQQLGDTIGRTPSWVSKIERGNVPLDRMSIVSRIAEALSVEVVELTGQPYRHRDPELESGHSSIPALRLALQHATLPVPVVVLGNTYSPARSFLDSHSGGGVRASASGGEIQPRWGDPPRRHQTTEHVHS